MWAISAASGVAALAASRSSAASINIKTRLAALQ
jgi:hypothetical protein